MNPVLHISSWPSVVESMTPRDQLRVGWLSGAYDANLGPVLEALRTRVPVTLEAVLFVEDEVADATTLVDLPSDLIRCSLRAPSAGHQLATLDLIFLPDTALVEWRDVLSNWALPPVIFASGASTGQLGLTVDPSAVDASAALGALVLLDPPTRRKSLDLLRGMVAVDAVGDVLCRSRVEGVFDSSYSLALVNRQLAMALDARGEVTYRWRRLSRSRAQPGLVSLTRCRERSCSSALGEIGRQYLGARCGAQKCLAARSSGYAWAPQSARELSLGRDTVSPSLRQTIQSDAGLDYGRLLSDGRFFRGCRR